MDYPKISPSFANLVHRAYLTLVLRPDPQDKGNVSSGRAIPYLWERDWSFADIIWFITHALLLIDDR